VIDGGVEGSEEGLDGEKRFSLDLGVRSEESLRGEIKPKRRRRRIRE